MLVACTLAGRLAFIVVTAVVFPGLDEPAHEGAHTFVVRGLVWLDQHVGLAGRGSPAGAGGGRGADRGRWRGPAAWRARCGRCRGACGAYRVWVVEVAGM